MDKAFGLRVLAAAVVSAAAVGLLLVPTSPRVVSADSAKLTLSTNSGAVGAPLFVSGTGFLPNAPVGIYIDQPSPYVATPSRQNGYYAIQTDASGAFQARIQVPIEPSGAHSVCAATDTVKACAPFTVKPATISLSSTSGPVPTLITITGQGFPPNTDYKLTIDGQRPGFGCGSISTSDASGAIEIQIPMQLNIGAGRFCGTESVFYGHHLICLEGEVLNSPCADFLLLDKPIAPVPTLTVSPTSGPAGTEVTFTGSGFELLTSYDVRLDDQFAVNQLCDRASYYAVTDASGGFVFHMTVSETLDPCGFHKIVGQGPHLFCAQTGRNTREACATFTLLGSTSSPVPTPTPVTAHQTGVHVATPFVVLLAALIAALAIPLSLWIARRS